MKNIILLGAMYGTLLGTEGGSSPQPAPQPAPAPQTAAADEAQASEVAKPEGAPAELQPESQPEQPAPGAVAPEVTAAAVSAFGDVARVLQSPRCVNCHPAGDVPMVGENGEPHPMGIQRGLEGLGMSCQTCHRGNPVSNAPGLPPTMWGWRLPPAAVPMVFQNRTPAQLCQQLKDPNATGGRDVAALLQHVEADALVVRSFSPPGGRPAPPLSHADFAKQFRTWVDAGAPCPQEP